jgi:hypothetical protein
MRVTKDVITFNTGEQRVLVRNVFAGEGGETSNLAVCSAITPDVEEVFRQ